MIYVQDIIIYSIVGLIIYLLVVAFLTKISMLKKDDGGWVCDYPHGFERIHLVNSLGDLGNRLPGSKVGMFLGYFCGLFLLLMSFPVKICFFIFVFLIEGEVLFIRYFVPGEDIETHVRYRFSEKIKRWVRGITIFAVVGFFVARIVLVIKDILLRVESFEYIIEDAWQSILIAILVLALGGVAGVWLSRVGVGLVKKSVFTKVAKKTWASACNQLHCPYQ